MLFNSIGFALFLPTVFILYWFVAGNNLKKQNILLLAASYFFYGCWDYRFLLLLLFSTVLDFFTGIRIDRAAKPSARKAWLLVSVCINLGLLGFFKYYNFFIENFTALLRHAGYRGGAYMLNIILPVGISFYTFHGLSYVFDLYRRKIKPSTNFINYAVFVGFFPLLIAGPIERAMHLLPQVERPRHFDQARASDGLRQILWGLFKKMVIADNCAFYTDNVYAHIASQPGSTLLLSSILFSLQIYADFSGYSDIAIGTGKLLGFDILRNFAYPYFSRDIAEFWRRWHMSLTSWFRDYLYIPLGGSTCGKGRTIRNIMIVFLVSALWHGARWTYICWGVIHALFFLPLLLSNSNRKHITIAAQGRFLPSLKEALQIIVTFGMVSFAWIFFRAETMEQARSYISRLFSASFFQRPQPFNPFAGLAILLLMAVEWMGREQEYALAGMGLKWSRYIRWSLYYSIIALILLTSGRTQQFIYFQF